tara:strand:+ start:7959 stop:8345 length:387 start_codon:yes stop_codon:yes gene_type:complete
MKFVIKDNKDKALLINYLRDLGGDYSVDVKKQKNTRSMNQNKYYWKCIIQPLSKELGYLTDEMHDTLKVKFNADFEMVTVNDKTTGLQKVKSTTQLSTADFENYLERIRVWAIVDLGIRLRAPNEYNQ